MYWICLEHQLNDGLGLTGGEATLARGIECVWVSLLVLVHSGP